MQARVQLKFSQSVTMDRSWEINGETNEINAFKEALATALQAKLNSMARASNLSPNDVLSNRIKITKLNDVAYGDSLAEDSDYVTGEDITIDFKVLAFDGEHVRDLATALEALFDGSSRLSSVLKTEMDAIVWGGLGDIDDVELLDAEISSTNSFEETISVAPPPPAPPPPSPPPTLPLMQGAIVAKVRLEFASGQSVAFDVEQQNAFKHAIEAAMNSGSTTFIAHPNRIKIKDISGQGTTNVDVTFEMMNAAVGALGALDTAFTGLFTSDDLSNGVNGIRAQLQDTSNGMPGDWGGLDLVQNVRLLDANIESNTAVTQTVAPPPPRRVYEAPSPPSLGRILGSAKAQVTLKFTQNTEMNDDFPTMDSQGNYETTNQYNAFKEAMAAELKEQLLADGSSLEGEMQGNRINIISLTGNGGTDITVEFEIYVTVADSSGGSALDDTLDEIDAALGDAFDNTYVSSSLLSKMQAYDWGGMNNLIEVKLLDADQSPSAIGHQNSLKSMPAPPPPPSPSPPPVSPPSADAALRVRIQIDFQGSQTATIGTEQKNAIKQGMSQALEKYLRDTNTNGDPLLIPPHVILVESVSGSGTSSVVVTLKMLSQSFRDSSQFAAAFNYLFRGAGGTSDEVKEQLNNNDVNDEFHILDWSELPAVEEVTMLDADDATTGMQNFMQLAPPRRNRHRLPSAGKPAPPPHPPPSLLSSGVPVASHVLLRTRRRE